MSNTAAPAGTLGPARRAIAFALWLALMVAGALLIARSQFSADLSAFLPATPDAGQRVLIEQVRSGAAARTLMLGITGGQAAQRAEASRALAARLRADGGFELVGNGDTAEWQASGAAEWLFRHRYHLSPAVAPERFGVGGLREAIDDTLGLLGTPAGAMVKPLLETDPTGEMQRIAESMVPSNAPRSQHGVWVSRQADRALLLLQGKAPGSDLDAYAALIARVREAFAQLQAQPAYAGLQLQVSGAPLFAVDSRARIEREVHLLAVAGTVVMGALLLLAFASLPALLVAFLPVATGVVAGIVAVSLAFGTVHGITLGFGSTLIGEAVDYAIYYLIQARGAAQPGTGWMHWRRQSWPTVRLGLLTSVCGFAALVFSGFPGLAQLGVFSLAGLLAAAFATRWVLPALMPDGAAGMGLRAWLGRHALRIADALPRLRALAWAIGALVLAALVVTGVRQGGLWHGDLASLSPVPREQMLLDEGLRNDLGASDARTLVVVQGPDMESALQAAEAAGQRLESLVAQGALAGYDSPARFLPSQAAQRARLASLPDAGTLRARLAEATAGGPLRAERLERFVEEVQAARQRPLIGRESLAGGPLAPLVDAMLTQRQGAAGGQWMALLSLQAPQQAVVDAPQVRRALQDLPQAQVVDIKQSLDALYQRYLHEAIWQAGLGALAVVALMAVALRGTRRLLAVCQPLALAVLVTLGALVLAQVPLGILHLVGLLLVVAVGSNYALFFDQFRHQGAADAETMASLVLANVTTVLSFGLIALSKIPALSAIGVAVAPGALLALLLSAAFAPRRRAHAPGGAGPDGTIRAPS